MNRADEPKARKVRAIAGIRMDGDKQVKVLISIPGTPNKLPNSRARLLVGADRLDRTEAEVNLKLTRIYT